MWVVSQSDVWLCDGRIDTQRSGLAMFWGQFASSFPLPAILLALTFVTVVMITTFGAKLVNSCFGDYNYTMLIVSDKRRSVPRS